MKNPRINVTLNPSDIEVMEILCEKKQMSMSSLAKKMIEEWLEDYEDMLLARRAEEAEKRWIEGGSKTISHEELCQELGIESNIHKTQQETSKNSLKTSKKESSVRSRKGSVSPRKKLASR
jgi:predicted DNA-binding protein